jgi:hypothetical protein
MENKSLLFVFVLIGLPVCLVFLFGLSLGVTLSDPEAIIYTLFVCGMFLLIYTMDRSHEGYDFVKDTNKTIHKYNVKKLEDFWKIQRENMWKGLPLEDPDNVKLIEYLGEECYYPMLFSFTSLTKENWLSKEDIEELNKFNEK